MIDQVEEIKERTDIVEVISSYLTVKRAGANMKAPCPFHNEKTPSFMISPERQTFKCFGCGEGGDVFTFIEKMEGVDFYNALKILADRAGVRLQSQSISYGGKEHKSDRKTRLFEMNSWAEKVYHKVLVDHPKAEKGRNYLKKRGIKKETIETFKIGYAPASWDFLIKFLKTKGYKEEEMAAAGLAIRNEKGGYYDRFRGRIMFPIWNIMGATVAFTSRILEEDKENPGAKYINSSESPIYTKGKTIYGLDKAKMSIKEKDQAVFVEGNMDVLACHQAGFKNVVATSGTAITEDQIKILSRYTFEIAFCFDNDEAGIAAMKKAIQIALKNDISAKIIALPVPFKDPDEAIKSDPKNWAKAEKNSFPALEYWIDLLIRKNPELGLSIKKKIAKEILPVIKIIFSDIEKEYYLKYLAKKLAVSEKALLAALSKTKMEKEQKQNDEKEKITKLKLWQSLFGIIWAEPALIDLIKDEINQLEIDDERLNPFLLMLQAKKIEKDKMGPEASNLLDQYTLSVLENFDSDDKEIFSAETKYLLGRIKRDQKEGLKSDFASRIEEAEKSGDKEKVKKLLSQFSSLIK